MRIINELKNNSSGTFYIMENGDIVSEGNYYIIMDKKLKSRKQPVRISVNDILRVGEIKFSSTAKLVGSISCFGICGLLYPVYSYVHRLSAKARSVAAGAGYISEIMKDTDVETVYITPDYAEMAATNTFNAANAIQNVICILIIILLLASITQLIMYGLSHKRLVEINTVYGSFCINRRGIHSDDLRKFIDCFNAVSKGTDFQNNIEVRKT